MILPEHLVVSMLKGLITADAADVVAMAQVIQTSVTDMKTPPRRSTLSVLRGLTGVTQPLTLQFVGLTAALFPGPKGTVFDIALTPGMGPYDQATFERDLRALQDLLKRMSGPVALVFTAGGDLVIPDWFREFCQNQGIRLIIIEPGQDVGGALGDILDWFDPLGG